MKEEPVRQRRLLLLLKWGVIFGCWTLLGLLYAGHLCLIYARSKQPVIWTAAISWALIFWYSWAILSPLILRLARRFPLERQQLFRGLLIHLPVSFLFALLHQVMAAALNWLLDLATGKPSRFTTQLLGTVFSVFLLMGVVIYWMILFASHALDYQRRYREEELRASRLETELAQAELQALMMQLHPHFLFNTLHAISALIHKSPEAADQMIARLSDLLRITLENIGAQEVSLKQELEFLEKYLEIEQTRFQDRLSVQMRVGPETLDARVPHLVLQPLVENAIRHGIATRATAGKVEISASRANGMLRLEVRDDGPGLPVGKAAAFKEGIGLANTRARIKQMYGDAYSFELRNATDGGLMVKIAIPFRVQSNGGADEEKLKP